jgi:uncharacterized protein
LKNFRAEKAHEIAVVTVPTIADETIETYAVKLFAEWGIGGREKDNGVLLLIARDEREVRIEVGYGLEGALTDLESKQIIDKVIVPAFTRGEIDAGVTQGVSAIEQAIAGEYAPPAPATEQLISDLFPFLIFGVWFFLSLVFGALARTKSWWFGGVLGGVAGIAIGFVFTSFVYGALSAALLIPLGLLIDFIASKAGGSNWFRGGGGFGGGFGGGGRSGGGFGGFGGGRHWHYEYHARYRYRADARDWSAAGSGRAAQGHHAPVPNRDHDPHAGRRSNRHSAGRWPSGRRSSCAGNLRQRLEAGYTAVCPDLWHWRVCGCWPAVRLVPSQAR